MVYAVRFQVFVAASVMVAVFWFVVQQFTLMMEAASSSEMSVH
jgi:hypothetical protein